MLLSMSTRLRKVTYMQGEKQCSVFLLGYTTWQFQSYSLKNIYTNPNPYICTNASVHILSPIISESLCCYGNN